MVFIIIIINGLLYDKDTMSLGTQLKVTSRQRTLRLVYKISLICTKFYTMLMGAIYNIIQGVTFDAYSIG